MRIALETTGGFTGRGIGSIVIEGTNALADGQVTSELTADEQARLHRLPILGSIRAPRIKPDAVVFKLTVDGQRWTWGETTAPPDFANWASALLAIRARLVGQTPSSM